MENSEVKKHPYQKPEVVVIELDTTSSLLVQSQTTPNEVQKHWGN